MLGSVRMFYIRYTFEVLSCLVIVSHLQTILHILAVVQRLEEICIMVESAIDSIKERDLDPTHPHLLCTLYD